MNAVPARARGWLSAHIYLGTTLILLALLHCGFQFGWNLHTLTLVLMLIVIFSGFFGVYAYLRYPTLMTRNRESATRDAMLEEISEIDQNALALADGIAPEIHAVVLRSIENTKLPSINKKNSTHNTPTYFKELAMALAASTNSLTSDGFKSDSCA